MGSLFGRAETVIFLLWLATFTIIQVTLLSPWQHCCPQLARLMCAHAIGWAQLMDEEMKGWAPIGVVAAIVPWNFPLMLLTWKVPSLAGSRTRARGY